MLLIVGQPTSVFLWINKSTGTKYVDLTDLKVLGSHNNIMYSASNKIYSVDKYLDL